MNVPQYAVFAVVVVALARRTTSPRYREEIPLFATLAFRSERKESSSPYLNPASFVEPTDCNSPAHPRPPTGIKPTFPFRSTPPKYPHHGCPFQRSFDVPVACPGAVCSSLHLRDRHLLQERVHQLQKFAPMPDPLLLQEQVPVPQQHPFVPQVFRSFRVRVVLEAPPLHFREMLGVQVRRSRLHGVA